jgi:hypothetical protein
MAIGMAFIVRYFGGSTPHALNEYYGVAPGIPTSGTIRFSDFDTYFRNSGITPGATSVSFSLTVDV